MNFLKEKSQSNLRDPHGCSWEVYPRLKNRWNEIRERGRNEKDSVIWDRFSVNSQLLKVQKQVDCPTHT